VGARKKVGAERLKKKAACFLGASQGKCGKKKSKRNAGVNRGDAGTFSLQRFKRGEKASHVGN